MTPQPAHPQSAPLIIDAHLDLSWNALSRNRDQTETVEQINQREAGMDSAGGRARSTTSLPEMRSGYVAVCGATLCVRAKRDVQPYAGHRRDDIDYGTQSIAYAIAHGQLAYYRLLEQQGEVKMIEAARDLEQLWTGWKSTIDAEQPQDRLPIGIILAMEGADPIVEPQQAEEWFRDGLRTVMLSHYGKSHYSVGTGDNGPLTPRGLELLKEFERIGMILDMTHLSDQSFYQAYEHFTGPLMASHNNCRALVPGDRQFSDEQIKMLVQRGAVIGVVCDGWMLEPDWQTGKSTNEKLTLTAMVDHIDHITQLAGNTQHAGIGSDLDGGYGYEQTPQELKRISDLHKLVPLLRDRGFDDSDIDNVFHANWLRFFRGSLPK